LFQTYKGTQYIQKLQAADEISVRIVEHGSHRVKVPWFFGFDFFEKISISSLKNIMAKTILVVEDQVAISQLIQFKLKNSGYRVVTAKDGVAALEKARSLRPDLILLDIMLPLMTGFEVLAALKKDEVNKNIPVIFLTGQSREDEIVKGLELGAEDYILKPFSPNELAARIKTFFQRSEKKTVHP
jgi:CheY-like chemotaxis protein